MLLKAGFFVEIRRAFKYVFFKNLPNITTLSLHINFKESFIARYWYYLQNEPRKKRVTPGRIF